MTRQLSRIHPKIKITFKLLSLLLMTAILIVLLLGCGLIYLLRNPGITQDCGYAPTLIQGRVYRFGSGEPIPIEGASVIIFSQGVGDCPGSEPIEPIWLLTDDEGRFYAERGIAGDDRLGMVVTTEGCDPYITSTLFWGSFSGRGNEVGYPVSMSCSNVSESAN